MDYTSLIKSNLHTHTTFCDGAHTPEENVIAALEAGMDCIGFSEHSYNGNDAVFGMKKENVALYRQEIERLKEAYRDRIRILCGIEQDLCGGIPSERYDYVIGSVHYLLLDGEYCDVDHSAERLWSYIQRHCGGDVFRFTKAYYRSVAKLVEGTQCDIIGHFDLVSKFNEGGRFFNESDPRYLHSAFEALDALLEKDVIFEINTGAISRGYRRTPYPAPAFLRRIAEKRGNIVINSDSHNRANLMYAFPMAVQIAKAAGFGSVLSMTKDGWKPISI